MILIRAAIAFLFVVGTACATFAVATSMLGVSIPLTAGLLAGIAAVLFRFAATARGVLPGQASPAPVGKARKRLAYMVLHQESHVREESRHARHGQTV
jgi:hypothetical protein